MQAVPRVGNIENIGNLKDGFIENIGTNYPFLVVIYHDRRPHWNIVTTPKNWSPGGNVATMLPFGFY